MEADFRHRTPLEVLPDIQTSVETLFSARTQSYREALLGCAIARNLNSAINLRHPYMNHGDGAFNGRTLDERVVNPFLQDRLALVSRGPYLATFRRSVKFIPETRSGLRDQAGYDACFFSGAVPRDDAREAAKQFFAQGHEINFVPVKDWAITTLSTIGPRCRRIFTEAILTLLRERDVPSALKVAWNDQIRALIT